MCVTPSVFVLLGQYYLPHDEEAGKEVSYLQPISPSQVSFGYSGDQLDSLNV